MDLTLRGAVLRATCLVYHGVVAVMVDDASSERLVETAQLIGRLVVHDEVAIALFDLELVIDGRAQGRILLAGGESIVNLRLTKQELPRVLCHLEPDGPPSQAVLIKKVSIRLFRLLLCDIQHIAGSHKDAPPLFVVVDLVDVELLVPRHPCPTPDFTGRISPGARLDHVKQQLLNEPDHMCGAPR